MKTAKELLDEAVSHQYDKGDSFRAIELYKVIIERFPDSPQATQASEYLEYLSKKENKSVSNSAAYSAAYSSGYGSRALSGGKAERFPTLTFYSQGLTILGWVLLLLSVVGCGAMFNIFEGWQLLSSIGLVFFMSSPIVGGLFLQAEVIDVFLSIERNTFEAKNSVAKIEEHIIHNLDR